MVLVLGLANPSRAEPVGSLGVAGELLIGETPRRRLAADAVVYVTRRYGVYLAGARATPSPWLDRGQVTGGVALRAAAARPTLDIVLHLDGGVAWPSAPVVGGGVTTYLWPVKAAPVALTLGAQAYVAVEDATAPAMSLGLCLGIALAR